MTRYFYTDPLAAAWMAKHFRVNFRNGDHEMLVLAVSDGEVTWFVRHSNPPLRYIEEEYYIHPDSLHLLNPQVEDIIFNDTSLMGCSQVGICKGSMENGFRIIQRDGKPFFWPESEVA